MFKGFGRAQADKDQDAPQAAPAEAPAPEPAAAAANVAAPAQAAAPAGAQADPRLVEARRMRFFGDLAALAMRDPQFRELKLADLEWLVAPAVVTRQAATMTLQVKSGGKSGSMVVGALWAQVSAEVDARLQAQKGAGAPLKLAPNEWKSGDNLWLLAVLAPAAADATVVHKLQETTFKDRPWKRYREPATQAAGAAAS